MYGLESYSTTTAMVSSWEDIPHTSWDTSGTGVAGANGHAGAAVTWAGDVSTTNALIYTTANLGFTSDESA